MVFIIKKKNDNCMGSEVLFIDTDPEIFFFMSANTEIPKRVFYDLLFYK